MTVCGSKHIKMEQNWDGEREKDLQIVKSFEPSFVMQP